MDVDCKTAAPSLAGVDACTVLQASGVAFVVLMAAFTSGAVTPDAPGIVAVEGARNPGGGPAESQVSELARMDSTPRTEPHADYGLPKDHPYTPPELRTATDLPIPLRTAEYYRSQNFTVHAPGDRKFRTHPADPDPIVVSESTPSCVYRHTVVLRI